MARIAERPPIVIGVDLGNASCRMAPWRNVNSHSPTPDTMGFRSCPAVVARDHEEGGWLAGASALEIAYRDGVELFDHLKDGILQERGANARKTAVQRLLSKLKFDLQAECAARVIDAVLSVPYSYTLKQRRALRNACSLAGLPVAGLINEPEAAVLGYRIDEQIEEGSERILVFDAGATRCTASVVRLSKQGAYIDIELLSEAHAVTEEGEPVGGDRIDARLLEMFERGRLQIPPLPSTEEQAAGDQMDPVEYERWLRQQLRRVLREARHQLSGETSFEFSVPWAEESLGRLTRDQLERWASFDTEITAAIQMAVQGARDRDAPNGLRNDQIDRVLITGGLNRSPLIRRLVDHFPHVEPCEDGFEEYAVAYGAARCAAILTGRCEGVVFRPRETPAFGIRTGIDTFDKVIPENAPPGFKAKKVYTLPNRYADRMVLEVCQGFSRRFQDELSLGAKELPLQFPEGAGKGTYLEREIHVEMDLADTRLLVTVTDRTKGISQPVPDRLELEVR